MRKKAIAMVHAAQPTVARLVMAIRDKGIDPFVVSSAADPKAAAALRELCEELDVPCAVARVVPLTVDAIVEAVGGSLDGFQFCLGVWDGHRAVMAEVNRRLGAPDTSPEALRREQDKYQLRTTLQARGLSSVGVVRASDPAMRERILPGRRYVVKPRRGSGSLCAHVVSSLEEIEASIREFSVTPPENDIYGEYYIQNEMIVEDYFEGLEFSVEMVRQNGRTVFACEHEKTALDFVGTTILERSFTSPTITLSPEHLRILMDRVEATMDAFELGSGCFHAEARIDEAGVCEMIEVNPRIGGGLLAECVRQQFGRSMIDDWVDILRGATLAPTPPRSCGVFFQTALAAAGRTVKAFHKNPKMRPPVAYAQVLEPGTVGRGDREEFAAFMVWRTNLATHAAEVRELMHQEYIEFEYE